MATGFEAALIKPVVDGLVALYRKASGKRLKASAEKALTEAIRELIQAPNDLRSPEAKIAVAKAAGIINADLVLAEEMLAKSRRAQASSPDYTVTRRMAPKKVAKKAAPKKSTAMKSAARKSLKKMA